MYFCFSFRLACAGVKKLLFVRRLTLLCSHIVCGAFKKKPWDYPFAFFSLIQNISQYYRFFFVSRLNEHVTLQSELGILWKASLYPHISVSDYIDIFVKVCYQFVIINYISSCLILCPQNSCLSGTEFHVLPVSYTETIYLYKF